jgi:hypothetical protein
MNLIIGISGKAQHGKDSFAKFLKSYFYHKMNRVFVKRICFADKLKEVTARLLYVDDWHMNDDVGKLKGIDHMGGITGREALQIIGTDIAREIYPDMWVFHYGETIKRFLSTTIVEDNNIILTPDMRFENEYDYIKDLNKDINIRSVTIRVIRPNYLITTGSSHLSETGLDHIDDWDFVVREHSLTGLELAASQVGEEIMISI